MVNLAHVVPTATAAASAGVNITDLITKSCSTTFLICSEIPTPTACNNWAPGHVWDTVSALNLPPGADYPRLFPSPRAYTCAHGFGSWFSLPSGWGKMVERRRIVMHGFSPSPLGLFQYEPCVFLRGVDRIPKQVSLFISYANWIIFPNSWSTEFR